MVDGGKWSNSPILLLILTLVSPQLFDILQNLNWDRASWNIKCQNEKIQIQSLFYTNFCKAHFHQYQSIMSILGNLRTSRRRNFGADDLSSCSLVKPGWKILPSDITFLSQAKSTSTLLSSISLFCVKMIIKTDGNFSSVTCKIDFCPSFTFVRCTPSLQCTIEHTSQVALHENGTLCFMQQGAEVAEISTLTRDWCWL